MTDVTKMEVDEDKTAAKEVDIDKIADKNVNVRLAEDISAPTMMESVVENVATAGSDAPNGSPSAWDKHDADMQPSAEDNQGVKQDG